MSFFENFNKKEEQPTKTEQIKESRHTVKLNLAVKLYEKGCTDDEVEEVLAVIETAETDIQIIKNSLIGTNINPNMEEDPMKPLYDGIEKIKQRQAEMKKELDETIERILRNKAQS